VIRGNALPEGWFGKPWACHQGARAANSDLLLFTDADTRHAPDLLRRAVVAMEEDGVQALTLNGRQEAGTFGELLIQPQIFALIGMRYPRIDRKLSPGQAGDAIANGQFILIERAVDERIGGHEAVSGEVAEDLRLAQTLTAAGHPVVFRNALDSFSTRMYRSLGEAIEGWTKNIAVGGRQAAGKLGALAPIGMVGYLFIFWVLPPLTFLLFGIDGFVDTFRASAKPSTYGAALGILSDSSAYGAAPSTWSDPSAYGAVSPPSLSEGLLLWSGIATALSALIWIGLYRRFLHPVRYAFLFPVGAVLGIYIAVRSWIRGARRIEWRGRRYSKGRSLT
jgi:chlorobactene glucosyltransferase